MTKSLDTRGASAEESILVVPHQRGGIWLMRRIVRQPDHAAVEPVIVATVLELLFDAAAHLKISRPWTTSLHCHFEEHTSDLIENQIVAWALSQIIQSSCLTSAARPLVRAAWRALSHSTTLQHFEARDCIGRLYNRLNEDYEQLHLLCRFFLEHTGPTLSDGSARTLPFVVNMARLFELFVAEWLRAMLPSRYELRWQDRATLGAENLLQFNIDMVLHDRESGRDIAVIDAKYKLHGKPSNDDVAQITLYAQLRDCRDGVLVYPTQPGHLLDATTPQHRLRSLWFDLSGDLEMAGQRFLEMLI